MPNNIPDHAITQFATNWEAEVQQKISRLKGHGITIDQHEGERKRYNVAEDAEWIAKTGRMAATIRVEQDTNIRWLYTNPFEKTIWFDEDDKHLIGQLQDPTSMLLETVGSGYNRLCDDEIIAAAVDSAETGVDGTTMVAMPAAQKVLSTFNYDGTAGATDLTIDKLIETKRIFMDNELGIDNPGELYMMVSPDQIVSLLQTMKVQSSDYNTVKALAQGDVNSFMGFTFIPTTRLPVATSVRTCIAYCKGAITFNPGYRHTYVDQLPDYSHAIQVRGSSRLGGCRIQDKKIVWVLCDES